MAIENGQVIIEIGEDAYKQNGVYRPWVEERTIRTATLSGISFTHQQALNALASRSQGLDSMTVGR